MDGMDDGAMNGIHKTHVVLHHSLTKDGQTVDFGAMERYHMSHRIDGRAVSLGEYERRRENGNGIVFEEPWNAIGYHVVIERIHGKTCVLMGRMPDQRGAHCRESGMNVMGIGICFVGNFDVEPVPPDMWHKGLEITRYFMRVYGFGPAHVLGHGEAQKQDDRVGRAMKTCPGLLFDTDKFRAAL